MNCPKSRSTGWDQLMPFAAALLFSGLSNAAFAQGDRGPSRPPIILESTGAYEVGGKVITKPDDPNQTLSCDHGYVEYFIPAKRRIVGLIMWHSSSTKVWENRWDGGEGYKSIFLRGDILFICGTARASVVRTGVASRSPTLQRISISVTLPPGVSA